MPCSCPMAASRAARAACSGSGSGTSPTPAPGQIAPGLGVVLDETHHAAPGGALQGPGQVPEAGYHGLGTVAVQHADGVEAPGQVVRGEAAGPLQEGGRCPGPVRNARLQDARQAGDGEMEEQVGAAGLDAVHKGQERGRVLGPEHQAVHARRGEGDPPGLGPEGRGNESPARLQAAGQPLGEKGRDVRAAAGGDDPALGAEGFEHGGTGFSPGGSGLEPEQDAVLQQESGIRNKYIATFLFFLVLDRVRKTRPVLGRFRPRRWPRGSARKSGPCPPGGGCRPGSPWPR